MTILVPADETHSGNAVVTAARGKSEPDTDIMKEIKVGLANGIASRFIWGGNRSSWILGLFRRLFAEFGSRF